MSNEPKTHDLGHGWIATLASDRWGETLTLTKPNGMDIRLGPNMLTKLRELIASGEADAAREGRMTATRAAEMLRTYVDFHQDDDTGAPFSDVDSQTAAMAPLDSTRAGFEMECNGVAFQVIVCEAP